MYSEIVHKYIEKVKKGGLKKGGNVKNMRRKKERDIDKKNLIRKVRGEVRERPQGPNLIMLKGLTHEIVKGYTWYGFKEPKQEKNL